MKIEEELIAKGISYLNDILQKEHLNNVDLDIDNYPDGTKRLSLTVDYTPETKERD